MVGSAHRSEGCLLNLLRNILDSPGEKEMYDAAANVREYLDDEGWMLIVGVGVQSLSVFRES